jgi:hypothetical protein
MSLKTNFTFDDDLLDKTSEQFLAKKAALVELFCFCNLNLSFEVSLTSYDVTFRVIESEQRNRPTNSEEITKAFAKIDATFEGVTSDVVKTEILDEFDNVFEQNVAEIFADPESNEIINSEVSPIFVIDGSVEVIEIEKTDPKFRLFKLQERLSAVFSNFYAPYWEKWTNKLVQNVNSKVKKMAKNFEKKETQCPNFEEVEEMQERYNKENPCIAAKQLTNGFIKWSASYNINCRKNKEDKYHLKNINYFKEIENRLKKRFSCNMS